MFYYAFIFNVSKCSPIFNNNANHKVTEAVTISNNEEDDGLFSCPKLYKSIERDVYVLIENNKTLLEEIDKNTAINVDEKFIEKQRILIFDKNALKEEGTNPTLNIIHEMIVNSHLGNHHSIFHEVKQTFIGKSKHECDNFFDDIIEAVNLNTEISDTQTSSMSSDLDIIIYALKHLITSVIRNCANNYIDMNLFLIYPDLIQRNMLNFSTDKNRSNVFIFYDILHEFVHDNDSHESVDKENFLKTFIAKLMLICKKQITSFDSKALNYRIKYFNSKIIQDKQPCLIKALIEQYLQSKDQFTNCVNGETVTKCMLSVDPNDLTLSQAHEIFEIIKCEDLYLSSVYIVKKHFDARKYIQSFISFFGLDYISGSGICPFTQKIMTMPFSYGDMKTNASRFHTVLFWLNSLCEKRRMGPSFIIKNVMNREYADIRCYKINEDLKTEINKYIERIGIFHYYLEDYELYKLEREFRDEDIDLLATFIIDNYFEGEKQYIVKQNYAELDWSTVPGANLNNYITDEEEEEINRQMFYNIVTCLFPTNLRDDNMS